MASPDELDPEQAARVLARALELARQSAGGGARGPYRRLTLRDLERAATEVGVDPAFVQRAAVEIGETPPPRGEGLARALLGGPTSVATEMEVPVRIEVEDHEEVGAVLRERLGEVGTFNAIGRSLSWVAMGGQSYRLLQIEIRAGAESTRVILKESFGGLIGAFYGGIVGGAGFGLGGGAAGIIGGVLRRADLGLIAMLVCVVVSFVIARLSFARLTRKREEDVQALTREVAASVRACAERRAARVRIDSAEAEEHAEAERDVAATEEATAARSRGRAPS